MFSKKNQNLAINHERRQRRATAILVCIFVVALLAAMLVAILDTETLKLTAMRNTADYEKALYLAGAGVHQALAELENNYSWRTGIPSTELPVSSGNTFSATVTDGSGGDVIITGVGQAGGFTRTLQITISNSG